MSAAMRSEGLSLGAATRPTRRIRSIVFDTAVDDLRKQNILLRGYEMHGASFVELSWSRPVASGARGSIELRVPTLDVGKMLGYSQHLRQSIADRPLESRCVAETERRERVLERARARIAVCFDDGFVESGGRRSNFHEIELQLLDGAEQELWSLAAELARRAPVRFLQMNAIELALAHATGTEFAPVKGRRPTLAADATLDSTIVATLSSCLDQFVANWPALHYSDAPEEAIHQMRVALRRLRAGVGMLRRGVASEALEIAAMRARGVAATLGEARNLDILVEMLSTGALAQANCEPSFYALVDSAERRRIEAHAVVQALVAAPETTQFVVELRAALAAKAWRSLEADAPPQRAFDASAPGSAREFAVRSLDRLHRRALKKSRDLASLSPEQRHEARIAFKKARYAAEFFESLFDARAEARRYLKRTAALQDALGAFNDLTVAAELLHGLGETDAHVAPASAFAVGWCAHARDGASMDWKKTEKSLKKLDAFWR